MVYFVLFKLTSTQSTYCMKICNTLQSANCRCVSRRFENNCENSYYLRKYILCVIKAPKLIIIQKNQIKKVSTKKIITGYYVLFKTIVFNGLLILYALCLYTLQAAAS